LDNNEVGKQDRGKVIWKVVNEGYETQPLVFIFESNFMFFTRILILS